VVAWGCTARLPLIFLADWGQCSVPAGLTGVTAIAAGFAHSAALKANGTVVTWGCGGNLDLGQCGVPTGVGRVAAIAASFAHSLTLVEPQPSIALVRAKANRRVAVLKVKLTNWTMYPTQIGQLNKLDGGHWRIVVDGKANNLSTDPTTGKTTKLRPGKHRISARLENNDRSNVAGTSPSRTLTVVIKAS
jgi:hypothetical protein